MAGCGGNCQCASKKAENRESRTPLAEALAKTIVDNRIIMRTVELYELGVVRVEDLIDQINADKINGLL